MCTLAVYVDSFAEWPLVVAANRDEILARPAEPPTLLRADFPRAVGGRDAVAAGTWLGVNEAGLVAGLLNRRSPAPPDPDRRSRGHLCLEALGFTHASDAAAYAGAEPAGRYNGFNLLVADPGAAFVVSQPADEAPRVLRLDPGLHVLTNLDVNDPRCPRIAASQRAFAAAGDAFGASGDVDGLVARLRQVLGDHTTQLDPRGPGSLCVHAEGYGTRSSSILLVGRDAGVIRYFHADGPPCRTALASVTLPF